MPVPHRGGSIRAVGLALLGWSAAVFCLLWLSTRPGALPGSLDDAFVVLDEARAWASELGLGGGMGSEPIGARSRPLVEGSTSPLDVLAKWATSRVAPAADPLEAAGWVGLLWLGLGALSLAWAIPRWGGSLAATTIASVGWASSLGLVEAAGYRLEGPLFGLIWLLLLLAVVQRAPRWALALSVLLAWARPEGMLLGPLAFLLAQQAEVPRLRAIGLACLGPLTLISTRLALFGRWAPQSYYAKRSDALSNEILDGLQYLDAALRSSAGLGLVVLGAGLIWWWFRRSSQGSAAVARALAFMLLTTGAAAVVLVASGGDGYLGARLALPLGAPLWIGAALVLAKGQSRGIVWLSALVALGLQLAPLGASGSLDRGQNDTTQPLGLLALLANGPSGMEAFAGDAEVFEATGNALGGETLAHRHAQRIRWFCPDLTVLDLTGITSDVVSRLPAPGRVSFGRDAVPYALEQRVGAIFLDVERARPTALSRETATVLADPLRGLQFTGAPLLAAPLAEALAREYACASLPHPGARGWFNLLVRRDLAERFRTQGFQVGP